MTRVDSVRTMQRNRTGRPAGVSLSVILRSLIVGPILLAAGVSNLVAGSRWWLSVALWIWCVVAGSVMFLLGLALLAARRDRSGR